VAGHADWQLAIGLWAPALLLMAVLVARLPGEQRSHFARIDPRTFRKVLGMPGLAAGYLAIFCVFFIFAAMLNVLPFRMTALDPAITATAIGFAYAGYLSGLVVTLNAARFARQLGSERRVYGLGLLFYGGGLLAFSLPSIGGIYASMFVFCAGMFLLHTRLSGQMNHLGHEHKGVVNGIYIASYYFGGALGSWLPAELYRYAGWQWFLGLLLLVLGLAGWNLLRLLRQISNA
jgi:YNFM family putative membrane transporter